jgi:hypothetical protein
MKALTIPPERLHRNGSQGLRQLARAVSWAETVKSRRFHRCSSLFPSLSVTEINGSAGFFREKNTLSFFG